MIIEQIGMQEIWVDGFGNYALRNGIMRCVGYSELPDGARHGTVRLIYSLEAALAANVLARNAICLPVMREMN